MNSFDIAVILGLLIAVGTGFGSGLIRSAITILAYIVAMPIAVWVMSFVPPLTENYNSPLMQNAGFFLGAFLVIAAPEPDALPPHGCGGAREPQPTSRFPAGRWSCSACECACA